MNPVKHLEIIRNLFIQVMDSLEEGYTVNPLSDLFIQVDRQSGEVFILNNDEETLAKETVFDWVQLDKEEREFYPEIVPELKSVISRLNEKNIFDKLYVVKPFSITLVNEEFKAIEKLLFLDDDTLKLDNNIWKTMNKELDDFMKNLFSDTK